MSSVHSHLICKHIYDYDNSTRLDTLHVNKIKILVFDILRMAAIETLTVLYIYLSSIPFQHVPQTIFAVFRIYIENITVLE